MPLFTISAQDFLDGAFGDAQVTGWRQFDTTGDRPIAIDYGLDGHPKAVASNVIEEMVYRRQHELRQGHALQLLLVAGVRLALIRFNADGRELVATISNRRPFRHTQEVSDVQTIIEQARPHLRARLDAGRRMIKGLEELRSAK